MKSSTFSLRSRLLAAAIVCTFAAPVLARDAAPTDRFIVRFKDGTAEHGNANARQRRLDAAGRGQGLHVGQLRRLALGADVVRTSRKLDAVAARDFMAQLRRDPNVAYVEPDARRRIAFTPNDTNYSQQLWHYSDPAAGIGAPAAWDTATGSGVVVAVIDTGYTTHSDLGGNLLAGYDFISDTDASNDGNGRDADAHDTGDATTADECDDGLPGENSSWHGTHVAGTIAALTNNAKGVAGIAFNAKVLPLRTLGKCGGSTSDIADAIVWAAGGSVTGVPANANPAEVINLSLGGEGGCDSTSQAAIDYAVAHGAVVVVAAGNESDDAAGYSPASCANVVTVAAVGSTGALADYSNYGEVVDLSAPGGFGGNGVMSTHNAGAQAPGAEAYAEKSGTSMAAPHVAGVAALMQSADVNTPALVETILKGSARAFPIGCTEGCGSGLLTAPAALHAVTTPFLYVSHPVAVYEGDSGTQTVTFTVTLSQPRPGAVTFNIATANGTATAGSDFVAKSATAQTIPAGQLSKTFSVTVNGDTTTEAAETFHADVSAVTGIEVLDPRGTATVLNNDGPVLANGVPLTGLNAAEGTLTLYRMEVPIGATNLRFTTAGKTTQDADLYVRRGTPPTTATYDCISAGVNTTESCTIGTPQGGTWYVLLHAYSTYSALTLEGEYTAPTTPTLSIAHLSIVEGNSGTSTATFVVSLSQATGSTVSFNAATENGTAVSGSDYVAKTWSGLTIPAGQLSKTVSVTLNGDTAVEANEAFYVRISAVTNAIAGTTKGKATVLNDDGPTLTIADPTAISEGNSGTKTMTFTVKLSQPTNVPVTYTIATASYTATAGSDFVARTLTGETIPAGQTSRTFAVTLNGDTTAEANERVLVNLSAVTGVSLLDPQGRGTILNDDGVTLSMGHVTVTEGNSGTRTASFPVTLSQPSSATVSFNVTTLNGTAVAGTDFNASTQTGLTIPAGQTSRTVNVTVKGDTTVEANEAFYLTATSASNATVLSDKGKATLLNDDGPTLSINDVSTSEGNSGTKTLTFTVSLSQVAAGAVTYSIATANHTATAGSDYVAKTATGQTIPAGQLAKTFAVTINGDTAVEASELLLVNLSAVTGASVLDAQGRGTITNDD